MSNLTIAFINIFDVLRAAAIMMQTGPVVTLKVEKFAASYHGLWELLKETSPENRTTNNHLGMGKFCTSTHIYYFCILFENVFVWKGDGEQRKLNNGGWTLHCVVDGSPSERLHGGSKRKKDQRMQKNRQLYRSNPNMTGEWPFVVMTFGSWACAIHIPEWEVRSMHEDE